MNELRSWIVVSCVVLRYFAYRIGLCKCPNVLPRRADILAVVNRVLLWRWRLRIVGLEHCPRSGPAIFAGNHAKWDDPVCMYPAVYWGSGRNIEPYYMMRDDFFENVPHTRLIDFDEVMRLFGTHQISRERVRMSQLKPFVRILSEDDCFIMFPGRTRTRSGIFFEWREGMDEPGSVAFFIGHVQHGKPEVRIPAVPVTRTYNPVTKVSTLVMGEPLYLPPKADRETQRERLRAEGEATRAKEHATQEHQAKQRAESAEASATVALEFLRNLLFSVDAYNARDQRLDLDYVFREAALHLHELERLDPRASALGYGVLGRVATDWGRFNQAEQWLTRGAELWAMTADRAPDPEALRKARMEQATVLNHLAWAALGDQQDTHGLSERAARAATAAKQAFDLDLEELGPRHDNTLCSQADWLRMRQLAGETAPTVIMAFVDWLATAAGQSREEFLSSFAGAVRESARLSAEGDAAGARDTISIFLDQVFSRERPRLRARVPLSLPEPHVDRGIKLLGSAGIAAGSPGPRFGRGARGGVGGVRGRRHRDAVGTAAAGLG